MSTREQTRKTKQSPSDQANLPEARQSSESVPRADAIRRIRHKGARLLTEHQLKWSVANFGDELSEEDKLAQKALEEGAVGAFDAFSPADAVESTLASVMVALKNAVMLSFASATTAGERRDIELNSALKGVSVLADLVQAYDAHRGFGKRHVSVGNVNVEPGAQAIVGNVESRAGNEQPSAQSASNDVPQANKAGSRPSAQ